MIEYQDMTQKSPWLDKLNQILDKYEVGMTTDGRTATFCISSKFNEDREDDFIEYKFNTEEGALEYKSIYQMDELEKSNFPEVLEDTSDIIKLIKLIHEKEISPSLSPEKSVSDFANETKPAMELK